MKKYCLIIITTAVMAVLFGCQSGNQMRSADLIVGEQIDSLWGNKEYNNYYWVSFDIDAPVNGPRALVDSVTAFINGELYKGFEICAQSDVDTHIFRKEDVYTDEASHLLGHYIEKYKKPIQDNLCNSYGLSLKMEAQTDSFVTYGLEWGSRSSEKYYHTFSKRDGHQLKEIISLDNLARFFEDYPEYNHVGADAWAGYPGWTFSRDTTMYGYSYGLLVDHFELTIIDAGNYYKLLRIPYGQIFSYLSPEVQELVKQKEEEMPMLPAYLPDRSEDGQAWMEVDTVKHELLGYISAAGGPKVSRLMQYEPELEIYPKRVHSIDANEASTVFLFIYSRGHLMYCDEALVCIHDDALQPAELFSLESGKDSVISCMWYDQLVDASDGFPYDEFDDNRFGIHYDQFTKRLYVPIMEDHEKGSEFENCQRYTGRYHVMQFDGKEFVLADEDGSWWLNKDLRNYKRTVSNRHTAEGIEQTDLMPDGMYRHAVWKGANTLDDLRKKPDEVKVSKQMN